MHPMLMNWRGLRIPSYPAMLYLGIVLGAAASGDAAASAGMDRDRVVLAVVLLAVPALIGARLLFVATNWSVFRQDRSRIWNRSDGGAAMLGGLPLAVAVSVPVLAVLELPWLAFWDAATFTLLTGMFFTRIGCLLHGCCGGRPSTRWIAVNLPDYRGNWRPRVPTQFLEMTVAVMLLTAMTILWESRPFAGLVFLATVGTYGLVRASLQPLREVQEHHLGVNVQIGMSLAWGSVAYVFLMYAWFTEISS